MGIGSAPPGAFSRPATKSREKGGKTRTSEEGKKRKRKERKKEKKERKKETRARATGGVRRKGKGERERKKSSPYRDGRTGPLNPSRTKKGKKKNERKITRGIREQTQANVFVKILKSSQ